MPAHAPRWSRRSFLRCGAALAASLPWLSSCKSLNRRDLIFALGWVPNVEYADLWVALEKGYFAQEKVAREGVARRSECTAAGY